MRALLINLFSRVLIIGALSGVIFMFIGIKNSDWINRVARETGFLSEVFFVAGGTLCTALGLPRQTICFLGGYTFGLVKGSILALVASVGGCLCSFTCARLLGRSVVLSYFPESVHRTDVFLQSHPFSVAFLLRLLPIGSNILTNLVAGISSVQMTAFVAGSTLGYVPQTVIFALLGSGIHIDRVLRISLSAMLFALSALVGAWLLRRHGSPSCCHANM